MSQSKKKHVPLMAALLVSAACLLAACSSDTSSASSGNEGTEPVVVRLAINGGTNLFTIIREKGWLTERFKEHHAIVEWSEFQSGPPLLESLAAKRVDLSLLGDGAALQGQSAGLPFVNVGLISSGSNLNSILVPADSAIQQVEELRGKKIALAKGTTSHVYLLKKLANHGLTEQDVEIVNLQFSDALPAFSTGSVDAWVSIDPFTTQLTQESKARIVAGKDETILAPVALIARTDFAKEHPELVTEFLKVYKEAIQWQNTHLDEVAQLFAADKKIPVEILKQVLSNQNAELTPITEDVIATQQASAEILQTSGFLKKPIEYKEYVDNSYLERLNP
ncbi:aliphatic sulfonate ABC transporter substrate-binding protein [Paenibacillus sp. JCM 10914]|uniref:aliphatic sulfonate ABC transporter substrate-binding protein n=1 Tax=Paenibacillus sp. JCM 10914 TaxID=1236974 RepID=UPI0003CC2EC5|nr:aliphatic sulfonate ABC transporter substrate-binding protein [Paenibacillus sp. JCM 10914]GAE05766.1 alkanesulfonates-binding protein [Paenibacillus sp. JCM 10914]